MGLFPCWVEKLADFLYVCKGYIIQVKRVTYFFNIFKSNVSHAGFLSYVHAVLY